MRFLRSFTRPRKQKRNPPPSRRSRRALGFEELEPRIVPQIYVDGGNLPGPGSGTLVDPFVRIQDGINAALPGHPVFVAEGTYRENLVMRSGVSVLGAGAARTSLIGAASVNGVVRFNNVTDATLSGFKITVDVPISGVDHGVVFQGNTNATAVLQKNVITGAQFGILVSTPAMPTIQNNTLAAATDDQGITIGNNPTAPTIRNNIIVGYTVAGIHVVAGVAPPTPVLRYNDVFANGMNYRNFPNQTGLNGNISADPLVVSPTDLHLRPGSPAVNAGDPSSPLDPDETRADMGAFYLSQRPTRVQTFSFDITGPRSVAFQLFSVMTPGPIRAEVSWTGDSDQLIASLTGRRRPGYADPTAPYATAAGLTPLVITYDMTPEDLARGVGWRLVLKSPTNEAAHGTIRLTTPFDPVREPAFLRERIQLRSGELWPGAGPTRAFTTQLNALPAAVAGLHGLISLTGTPECNDAFELERRGLLRQSFLPGNDSFGFVRKGINLADPAIAPFLHALTPLEPEDKLDPHILVGNYHRYQLGPVNDPAGNYVRLSNGNLLLSVLFARDVGTARAAAILGSFTTGFAPLTANLWLASLEPADVVPLAAFDEVEWIEAGAPPMLELNNLTRQTIGVNGVQGANINVLANTVAYTGLSGAGVTVGIHEGGSIDATNVDLNVVGAVNPGGTIGSHATHVAGIVAGSGVQSNTVNLDGIAGLDPPFQYRGIAPQAGLINMGGFNTVAVGGVFQSSATPQADQQNAINNLSLDVSNHSHLFSVDGNYDANSQSVDQQIRGGADFARRPQVYAAGNNGTNVQVRNGTAYGNQEELFSLLNETKNAIIVGNWDALNALLASSSSMGPTYDGRIKPDVIAPGTRIISTEYNEDLNGNGIFDLPGEDIDADGNFDLGPYTTKSGTSMASPAVAGVLALLLQGWQNTYNVPLGLTLDANAPLPSTLRAILIQTATDIVQGNEDLDFDGFLDAGEDTDGDGLLDRGVSSTASVDVDSDSNPANGNNGLGVVTAPVGPDYATGWGLVNAQAAVNLLQNARMVDGVPVPKQIIQDTASHAQIIEYDFVVDQVGPIRITLAWDDFEAAVQTPIASPRLVNDLDLELIAPDGTIWYPWQLGQTIADLAGNPLANNAQPPGTPILVQIPFQGTNNPAANNDAVPQAAMVGNGAWVATTGKDHLNNVEQVFVQNAQPGHWKVRVIGFKVQAGMAQDFSLVGMPYPDLPDLVATSGDKVALPNFATNIDITWTVRNVGAAATATNVDYRVLLSKDFFVDGTDVVLFTSAANAIGLLAVNATQDIATTVQITQAQADQLMGTAPGVTTVQSLIDNDVFLIVQVDPFANVNNPLDNLVFEHRETNTTFLQLGRLVDVVLVLDSSGSMRETVPVSSGEPQKIELLQNAANLFLGLLRLDAGDRLGEVSFNGSVSTIFDGAGIGSITAITTDNIDNARGAVDDLTADGSTNIRDALQRGLDLLTAAPGGDGRRRVIVFLSDGKRTAGGDPLDPAFLQQFIDEDVHVFSVGFGSEGASDNSGIDTVLLQTLAGTAPHGFFHVTESDLELDKFFVNAVAGAIRSEVIVDPIATLEAGGTDPVSVTVSEQDSTVTFILTWDNPALDLDLALRTPSGLEINAGNIHLFGDMVIPMMNDGYEVIQVHFPLTVGAATEHEGHWEMIVRNPGDDSVRYSASAIAETTIRALMEPPQPAAGRTTFALGESVPFQVRIHGDDQVPISHAIVRVTPNVPLVSLNALLSSGLVTAEMLSRIPTEFPGNVPREIIGPQERMIRALHELFPGRELLPRADLPSFELNALTAGIFGGSFTATPIDGVYGFVTTITGIAAECDPFQREITHSSVVGDPIVLGTTAVGISRGSTSGTVDVTVTPRGSGGTFAGPGLGAGISITASGLTASGTLRDNLDGSYVQTFTVPTGATIATLSIQLPGVALPPISLETRLPAPSSVNVKGARNDVSQAITITAGSAGDITRVTAVRLVAGTRVVRLTGVMVNATSRTVQVTVPAGLVPDLYAVYFEGSGNQGMTSTGVTFRVVGGAQNFPAPVLELAGDVTRLLQAATSAQGIIELSQFLNDLRALPTGANLTATARQAAVMEAVELITQGRGQPARADIPAILAAVNLGKIDARSFPTDPVATPQGTGINLTLGNGVSTMFGQVTAAGQTMASLRDGPAEIPESRRGSPHLTYDISTTAVFNPSLGVQVTIDYEEGDFPNESALRLFHREGNLWVDRTISLDPTANRIRASVTTLGQFVLVVNPGSIPAPAVTVTAADSSAAELGPDPGLFVITRYGPITSALTVFFTVGGTATPGADYVALPGSVTIPAGATTATLSVLPVNDLIDESPETVILTIRPDAAYAIGTPNNATVTIADDNDLPPLRVTALTPTTTGFQIQFNRPFDPSMLNLYDTQTGGLGPADVTFTGSSTGPVRGSLVFSGGGTPDPNDITFIRTGGMLPADSYTLSLRSAFDAFREPSSGSLLDGNGDGTPGDDYVARFTVSPPPVVRVSVPDLARGPGQSVKVPATGLGLPLRLTSNGGVTSARVVLFYDSALLNITTAAIGPGVPSGASVARIPSAPGTANLIFNSPTALPAGTLDFIILTATVPDTAPYGSKQLLDLTGILINGVSAPGADDDGVHVVGYLGDATGNAGYSSADAARALRAAVGLDEGFSAFQLADPAVIADINGDGRLGSIDVTRLLQKVVGVPRPEFPPLPANPPTVPPNGPDPLLRLPATFTGRAGETITVPVTLDFSEGLSALDLALSYDTSRLEILSEADIRPGTLTSGFELFQANLDPGSGTLRVGAASLRTEGLSGQGPGSVLEITFHIKADAPAGPAVINLLHDLDPTTTQLNEGGLVLTPAPSNAAGDALDGLITVVGAPVPTVQRVVIDDGSGQRSKVSSITVVFSTVVRFPGNPADAFSLIGPHGRIRLRAEVSLDGDGLRTVVRLTFAGRDVRHGSLIDGRYTLTIDGDGLPGGDATAEFFRLYGDSDGDGDVDAEDLTAFLGTRSKRSGGHGCFRPAR